MLKYLILILSLITCASVFANELEAPKLKPVVIEVQSEEMERFLKDDLDDQEQLQEIDNGPIKEPEVETIENNVFSIHLGTGITEYLVWFEGSDLSSGENFGFVYGLQYSRNNLIEVFDHQLGWSILGLSHKTYLTGPHIQFSKLSVGLLGGVGITDIDVGVNVSDPFNPELTEEPISGFVAGIQLQFKIHNNWHLIGTATTNKTFIGGVGFGF